MNDSELRRRELLKQTRRLYQDSAAIPAVHPRYGHIYHELYDTPDSREADISSTQIVNEIQKEISGNEMDFINTIKLN